MPLEQKDKEKMIETCKAILDSCDKPFVWAEEESEEHDNYKKPFNIYFPHPQIEKELLDLFTKFSGTDLLYDQVSEICTHEEWFETGTYGLDRNINIYFSRYTLKPAYVEQVKAYFTQRLRELENQ